MASEPPTRPLGPRPDPYRGEELVTQRELVEDLQRSRTRATAGLVLAIFALAAGAVAIVLAATGDEESDGSDRRGASRSSVSNLREDVRAIEDEVDEIRGQIGEDQDAGKQLEELDRRLSQISDRQEQTSEQLQELQHRVDALEEEPSPEATPEPP